MHLKHSLKTLSVELITKACECVLTAEDRLKRLQDDLMGTERKLLQATKDLKRMGDIPDKDDIKVQIRQRMAKKMQLVGSQQVYVTSVNNSQYNFTQSIHYKLLLIK